MANYTGNSYATTITNLAAAMGCANDARTVAALLDTRWRTKEAATAVPPADPVAYAAVADAMRYLSKLINTREGLAGLDPDIAQRAGDLIAASAVFIGP